jgi:hypothetical protein
MLALTVKVEPHAVADPAARSHGRIILLAFGVYVRPGEAY